MNYKYTPEEIGQLNAEIDRLRAALQWIAEYDDCVAGGAAWAALEQREEEFRRSADGSETVVDDKEATTPILAATSQ